MDVWAVLWPTGSTGANTVPELRAAVSQRHAEEVFTTHLVRRKEGEIEGGKEGRDCKEKRGGCGEEKGKGQENHVTLGGWLYAPNAGSWKS